MLNFVAQGLPRVLGNALEDREHHEGDENDDSIADGRLWESADDVRDRSKSRDATSRGEVIDRPTDGDEGEKVRRSCTSVREHPGGQASRVSGRVGDDAPQLTAHDRDAVVDVLRSHHVSTRPATHVLRSSSGL